MNKLRCLLLFSTLLPASAFAHVGSPDVFFEGNAGPYHLFVTIRTPPVIPGVAEIEIRTESSDVREVRIVPLRLTGPGSELAPTADVAERSEDDPQFFTGSLWLMEFGSLQVRIEADGDRGRATVAVPVLAQAQRTLPMRRPLGALLFFLMIFLAVGAVSIVGASVREAKLDPGAVPEPRGVHRARVAMLAASVVVLGVIYLGDGWWNSEARSYAANVYKNPGVTASLESGGRLVLRPQSREWLEGVKKHPLIPDHNHLMHLFLIRLPEMEKFWHLHPDQIEPGVFAQRLPMLPAGRYQIFADIVHQSGLPETLVGEVELPAVSGQPLTGDDSEGSGVPLSQAQEQSTVAQLPDGGRIIWQRDARRLRARLPTFFRFRIEDSEGKPAQDVELYMGMPGHAEFVRSDRAVFAHVHPAGSVSMAALQLAQAGLVPGVSQSQTNPHAGHLGPKPLLSSEVSFPYGFPQPGHYRIFVQIKRSGRVETGIFDAHVE